MAKNEPIKYAKPISTKDLVTVAIRGLKFIAGLLEKVLKGEKV